MSQTIDQTGDEVFPERRQKRLTEDQVVELVRCGVRVGQDVTLEQLQADFWADVMDWRNRQ